jgi:hypothetical protein
MLADLSVGLRVLAARFREGHAFSNFEVSNSSSGLCGFGSQG